jgi:hypothetical protein
MLSTGSGHPWKLFMLPKVGNRALNTGFFGIQVLDSLKENPLVHKKSLPLLLLLI